MAAAKASNTEILSQLRIDTATTQKDVKNINEKLEALNTKFDGFSTNLKGYVPADIYRLNMEALATLNANQDKKIEDNYKVLDARLRLLEEFNNVNGGGIKFSNEIVTNILKTVGYVAAAGLIIFAGYVVLKNGGTI